MLSCEGELKSFALFWTITWFTQKQQVIVLRANCRRCYRARRCSPASLVDKWRRQCLSSRWTGTSGSGRWEDTPFSFPFFNIKSISLYRSLNSKVSVESAESWISSKRNFVFSSFLFIFYQDHPMHSTDAMRVRRVQPGKVRDIISWGFCVELWTVIDPFYFMPSANKKIYFLYMIEYFYKNTYSFLFAWNFEVEYLILICAGLNSSLPLPATWSGADRRQWETCRCFCATSTSLFRAARRGTPPSSVSASTTPT
jgi:hypothetical protein